MSSLSLVFTVLGRYPTNDYSAPVPYGHRDVPVRGPVAEVVISCGSEVISKHPRSYERGSTLVTTNLPFDGWNEVFGSERLTGALLDRLTHHVQILEMNGESYRLKRSRESAASQASADTDEE